MTPRGLSCALVPLFLLAVSGNGGAQVVEGRVVSGEGPVPHADVRASSGQTASAGGDGRFRLSGLPAGRAVEVTASALGHRSASRRLTLAAGETVSVTLVLEVQALPVDPLVVTGTLSETRLSQSPVKVEVVSARLLQRNASSSLMDAIGHINGLYQQVDCGVCYTNNIRINGMEGPYTAVLIDGMPIMGALASVYGLNGIDPALVQQLEILKGPQSTLYGTEAMGGVVNVITKDPRFAPRYAVDATRSDLGETTASVALAPSVAGVRGLLSGSLVHNDRFVDENGDGFSDLTLDTRLSLFGRASVYRDGREALGVVAKVYHENRFGGVREWTEAHRGSPEVYGESIVTDRVEVMARGDLPGPWLRLSGSYAWHRQDSWYGDTPFQATQNIGFGQLVLDPPRRGDHDPLVGVALRMEGYDDNTPATPAPDRRVIPGLFVEDIWYPHGAWTLLGGLRLDHHGEHGLIMSPRASAKWQPVANTVLRVNMGTGFRVVNLFTEDHAALTGARDVVIAEDLRPERSWSVAFNLDQVLEFGENPMRVDLDLFRTVFSNKIVPDYDVHPDRILYANLDGRSETRGLAVSVNQRFAHLPLFYTAGVTVQDVFAVNSDGDREDEFFAPSYKGVWTVSWIFGGRLTTDWTGTVVGPMRLPAYPEPHARPTRSPVHAVHNLQGTLEVARGREVYLGVKNVFDFRQGSPLVDAANPFGEAFDTNYVWGPIVGRRLVLGLRVAGGP